MRALTNKPGLKSCLVPIFYDRSHCCGRSIDPDASTAISADTGQFPIDPPGQVEQGIKIEQLRT